MVATFWLEYAVVSQHDNDIIMKVSDIEKNTL